MNREALFLNGRIGLNVLSHDLQNAIDIYRITAGHVVIGMLSKNYESNETAILEMGKVAQQIDNHLSIGLGAGDPKQWKMVAEIARALQPLHVNQICTATGYTRALLGQDTTMVNALVSPTNEVGYVNMAVGYLASHQAPTKIPIKTAIAMLQEMGASSIKYFPMNGLATRAEYEAVCLACAEMGFMIEPTGGITLDNFEPIVKIALDAGVKHVIPHVYSSIIDKTTGLTNLADVKVLYEIMQRLTQ